MNHEVVAGGVLAEQQRHLELPGAVLLPELAVDDLAEVHRGRLEIRHLDADGVFARDRCLDAQRGGLQRHLEVAGEGGDLLHARAEVEREGVLRHDGAGHVVGELRVDVEHLERVDEPLGHRGDILAGAAVLLRHGVQEVGVGNDVRTLVLLLLGVGRSRREGRVRRVRRGRGRGDRAHRRDGGGACGPGGGRFTRAQVVHGTRGGGLARRHVVHGAGGEGLAFGLEAGAQGGALLFFFLPLRFALCQLGGAFCFLGGAFSFLGGAFSLFLLSAPLAFLLLFQSESFAFRLFRGLFVRDALLFCEARSLRCIARGRCGLGGGRAVAYVAHRVAVAVRRPVRQAGQGGDDVARPRDDEQGEDGEDDHEHARAEWRKVVDEAARHDEVAHRPARVGLDVQVAQQGCDGGRVPGHLQEAGDGEDEKHDAERAAAGVERLPQHEPEAGEHAGRRHAPDAESQELVAGVGEPVAGHAHEVGRGGCGGDTEVGNVAPVVRAQREEGEQRKREQEEPDHAAARVAFRFRSVCRLGLRHLLLLKIGGSEWMRAVTRESRTA